MPQNRFFDYGSDVDAFSTNVVPANTCDPGPYSGLDLSVNAVDQLVLTAGWGLQPDGVLWQEDTDITLTFSPPGVATTYTLTATHADQYRFGVVAVEYEVVTGELTSVASGVILGWIYHTGGGVPLDAAMLSSAPKRMPDSYASLLVATKPLELIPAYPRSFWDAASSGVDVTVAPLLLETVGQFLLYQEVRNSAMAPPELGVQHFQLYCDEVSRPSKIKLYCNVPAGPFNNLTVQVYGTDQVLVTSQIILSTTGWETVEIAVPRTGGVFTADLPYTLRLVFNLGTGQVIQTGRIKVSYWPYPV